MPAARNCAPIALLMLLNGATAPALHGEYGADCAPYDGPALRVTLPATGRGRPKYELRVNVPLGQLAGHWTHSLESRPGSATILLCRTEPETLCDYPQAGSFTLKRTSRTTISGTFDAAFADGTRRYRFIAHRARKLLPMMCG